MLASFCFREIFEILWVPEYPSGHIIIIQPSEQWTSRAMHKVNKVHPEEMLCLSSFIADMFNTIGAALPSPATLMFNRQMGGLMSKLGKTLILFSHDDDIMLSS